MTSPVPSAIRAHAVALLIGATVGTGLDAIHTHSGTTAYAREIVFRMAWWTPPLFGAAALLLLGAHVSVERALGRAVVPRRGKGTHALGALTFALAYVASGYLPASNAWKLALLCTVFVAGFACFGRSLPAGGLALAAALVGPIVEMTLVSRGAFLHLQPDVFGVPMWLPALYACASVFVGPLGLALHGAWPPPEREGLGSGEGFR